MKIHLNTAGGITHVRIEIDPVGELLNAKHLRALIDALGAELMKSEAQAREIESGRKK